VNGPERPSVLTRGFLGLPFRDIKRVRIVRRADGYYCQFAVKTARTIEHVPSGKEVGIDVGLKVFLTDASPFEKVASPLDEGRTLILFRRGVSVARKGAEGVGYLLL
jgi:transposase